MASRVNDRVVARPHEDQTGGLVYAEWLVARDMIAVPRGTGGQHADRGRRTNGSSVRFLPRLRWELIVDAA
jgi:hypothetical protein